MGEQVVTTLNVFGREAVIITDGDKVWARHDTAEGTREKPAVELNPENLYLLICEVNRDFMAEFYREALAGVSHDH